MVKHSESILVIQSEKSELKRVRTFFRKLFDSYKIKQSSFNKVYLCVSEAVINCIVHGNKNDINKKVSIQASFKTNKLCIKISDEGKGFVTSDLPDPTCEELVKKESGRGIFIINSLSDGVEFYEHGKSIQFKIDC